MIRPPPSYNLACLCHAGTARWSIPDRASKRGTYHHYVDVFKEEPLLEESPLWIMPNLLITARYSGATPHYHERAMDVFLDNLRRYVAGEPLQNVVDKARGY